MSSYFSFPHRIAAGGGGDIGAIMLVDRVTPPDADDDSEQTSPGRVSLVRHRLTYRHKSPKQVVFGWVTSMTLRTSRPVAIPDTSPFLTHLS